MLTARDAARIARKAREGRHEAEICRTYGLIELAAREGIRNARIEILTSTYEEKAKAELLEAGFDLQVVNRTSARTGVVIRW